MTPERAADADEARGRWSKARQFADAAGLLFDDASRSTDDPDVYVTLAVHSGIASADVICISRLSRYAPTGNHEESVALLRRADNDAAKHLQRLLSLKSKAGYAPRSVSGADVLIAERAYKALLEVAAASVP